MPPFVSCILPTRDRPAFVPGAIHDFLRQTYAHAELVVFDNGETPVAPLVPAHPRIRYVRHDRRDPIGALRNLACEQARGEFVAHWDDDDWSAPWRLEYQVAGMQRAHADIGGIRSVLFWDFLADRVWRYTYPEDDRRWVLGGSLLYRREYWRRHPFPEIAVGEDSQFVWNAADAVFAVQADDRFYVATVHPGNTSPRNTAGACWSPWSGDLRSVMGGDVERYRALAATPARSA
ncbi:MAG: glycosyltransferase family 2 protein [Burkholderiales bacterium]